ncbi:hypothetical protein GH714_023202 [Hevea brasiliensis]|uniref:Cytochrome P450 n=1 Tax=Hevea brasiliensis TaxID=3981 RepID=A0A6A6KLL7_HEVBR|nr:hypothetical protein GH714_023202 [Hevea brasiliensis]
MEGREVFVPTIKKLAQASADSYLADLYPSIKLLQVITGMKPRLKRLHQAIDKIIENIVDEHRTRKAEAKSVDVDEEEDLVDVLLNIQDKGDLEFPLTTDNIKAVILDMFIAGSDTSSTPVEWAMSEMLKKPKSDDKGTTRGILFGMANVELPLAQLLYHFDWKLPSALKPENLDMTEDLSITVKRRNSLYVIPIPYLPPPVK